jgi:hypothetical protein
MKALTILLASALAALPAQAFLVNVAFTDNAFSYTGPLVIGDAGDPWTAFSSGSGTPQAIGGGLTLTATGTFYGYYDTSIPALPPLGATAEYLYSDSTLTFDITGFNPALTYDIYLVANLDSYFDGAGKNATATGLNSVGPVGITNDSSIVTLTQGTNWILLEDVQPTALGAISLVIGNDVGVTALQISAIPEPSTYALLAGLGALGFAAWRRSRR